MQRLLSRGLLAVAVTLASVPALAQEAAPFVYGLALEQLEYRRSDDSNVLAWDGDAVFGRDEWKARWQSEGEYSLDESAFETLENQFLGQVPVTDFFDAKAGIRVDTPEGPDRLYGVLGLQGLAPQWFEIDTDLFVSEKGDVSARLDAEYELLITNRIILTPALEVDVAFSDDEEVGVGRGLSTIETGLRLSYDLIDRAVAPYIGVHYERAFGRTADFRRDEGEEVDGLYFVAGTRLFF